MRGREANELFATLALAGIVSEDAVGSNIAGVSKLNSVLNVFANKQKDGSGASCSFEPGN